MSACYLLDFVNVFQDMKRENLKCSVAFMPMFTLSDSTHTSSKRIFCLYTCVCAHIYMYSVTNCADFFFFLHCRFCWSASKLGNTRYFFAMTVVLIANVK